MKQDAFLNSLRGLTNMEMLSADLLGGLENIHLVSEFDSKEILSRVLKRL